MMPAKERRLVEREFMEEPDIVAELHRVAAQYWEKTETTEERVAAAVAAYHEQEGLIVRACSVTTFEYGNEVHAWIVENEQRDDCLWCFLRPTLVVPGDAPGTFIVCSVKSRVDIGPRSRSSFFVVSSATPPPPVGPATEELSFFSRIWRKVRRRHG
jgi:hypothetical protein